THVETPQQIAGMESGFTARQTSYRNIQRPEQGRMAERALYAGQIHTRGVKDADGVEHGWVGQITACVRGLEKVLITLHHAAKQKPFIVLRQKQLRLYLGVDGLRKDFVEGEAKQKRTQVIDVGDRSEPVKIPVGGQPGLLPAF